jgi:hypothetical protein
MRIEFEERLERELIAAARRASADAAGAAAGAAEAGAARRARRRVRLRPFRLLRPLPVALVALAAIAALAVAVLVVPAGEAPRPAAPAPQPLPRQCDRLARQSRLSLTAAPVDARLLAAFAILRRPQMAADRALCPPLQDVTLNPSAVRRMRVDPAGRTIYLVPLAARRSGSGRPYAPGLCIAAVSGGDRRRESGGGCLSLGSVLRGTGGGIAGDGFMTGVQPDGVATIELRMRNGRRARIAVVGNVWGYRTASRAAARANPVLSIAKLDAAGRLLGEWRGEAARGELPPA